MNIDKWKKKLINTLKNYLEENFEEKEFVFEVMYLFADAADVISHNEQRKSR
ncbi:MAG: hypothetical protein GDA51_01070 [Ekhidna sp.]|nr:hypothetical protein [Ekhidna sp.]MBC6425073.1 hypothetical protein [Ekhidna sp.]